MADTNIGIFLLTKFQNHHDLYRLIGAVVIGGYYIGPTPGCYN